MSESITIVIKKLDLNIRGQPETVRVKLIKLSENLGEFGKHKKKKKNIKSYDYTMRIKNRKKTKQLSGNGTISEIYLDMLHQLHNYFWRK